MLSVREKKAAHLTARIIGHYHTALAALVKRNASEFDIVRWKGYQAEYEYHTVRYTRYYPVLCKLVN